MNNNYDFNWKHKIIDLLTSKNKDSIINSFNIKDTYIPNSLFRYRIYNDKYVKKEIINQEVYASIPSAFNDPYDSNYRNINKNILKDKEFIKHINNIKKNSNISDYDMDNFWNIFLSYMAEESSKSIRNNLRVSCFSAQENGNFPINFPMWYHYADKYRGICIEYDMTKFNKNDLQRLFTFPIIYKNFKYNFLDIKCIDNAYLYNFLISIYKDESWSYENEWRFISAFDYIDNNNLSSNHINKYNKFYIKSIYIGYRASKKLIKKILYLSKNRYEVYIMDVSDLGIIFHKY